ncbi:MAG: efflux RND transporter permease subunit [Tepidisphaeraceae bacterium]
MWFVRLALRRPYTFIVASMLIIILGLAAILWMPTDIFPEINIPVIAVAFNYSGMTPEDMEGRMVTNFEGALTTTVNDIEHIESQSLNGVGIIKVYFYPNAKIEAATAQVTAIAQTALRSMPPGSQPPLIIQYNASNVPILQLGLGSDKLSEQQLFDYGVQFIRTGLVTVQGAQIPYPYGGKMRQIMVDLDPQRLYAWGISPADVSNAISAQNLVLPAGTTKIGTQEYAVHLNSSPTVVDSLNDLPIKTVNGTTVYIKDVAHVRDGFSVQNSIVHADGKRGALMVILKNGGSSTLDIVSRIKAILPAVAATVPASLKITPLFDQSIFVRASVNGVVKEAAIAAGLTGLMILLFLGSWRSTLIVVISIPLSILVSIIVLYFLGETLNVMTLGGMALAVGILVDDATVAIENIHRNIGQGKPLLNAILDGSQQIAVPAFVSTLCICIVFVPVAFITGAAKYLFTPLAMAVVFAMMTSYFLSRTLVPTLINYLLPAEMEMYGGHGDSKQPHTSKKGLMWRFHDLFNRLFENLRRYYGGMLKVSLEHRALVLAGFALLVLVSLALFPLIGRDFFPTVDAGQIRLHIRTPPGTRLEETERVFGEVENVIRRDIPASEIDTILDNMGIPNSSINLALSDGSLMSPSDGEVLVSLKPQRHPTEQYIERLNRDLRQEFPDEVFFFQPADIVTQVLNFGIAAPIDVQINGPPANAALNYQIARDIEHRIAAIPGAADVHILQVPHTPDLRVNVDRTMASQVGVTEGDVANDMLVSLSGTAQLSPNFWLDPKNGRQYTVLVQTPQYRVDSINELENSPVVSTAAFRSQPGAAQLLGNLAELHRGVSATNITHYGIFPSFDVMAGVRGTDLHSVAAGVDRIIAETKQSLPRGSRITVRGQVQSMNSSFTALSYGLIFAVVLVYLLMVVNFQSWLDPLIILMALPGALSGILWMLFITGTTLSVPALMGAIMSIGVATANSILVITFANDQRQHGMNAHDAALTAGLTRLRPVIMTALAMIIGMLPMSLGLGEGGEQNAPLGRAVIGGLVMATFATLFFVPIVYSKLRQNARIIHVPEELK